MELIRIPRIMQESCKKYLLKRQTIGFVPTMGALHDGHMSLIGRARMENDIVVTSLFVNPIQFGPSEDFEKYPREIENDRKKMQNNDVDILFLPAGDQMYPRDFSTFVHVDAISTRLCGSFRPEHFKGVSTVVAKLLNIVSPTRAYFGQKDFQQTIVIKRMVKDLNFDSEIVVCPTVRERDGLAMSSRNLYLNEEQRKAAPVLYRTLNIAADAVKSGTKSPAEIKELMRTLLSAEKFITEVDYASLYDPETLDEIDETKRDILIAAAVRFGDVRLIDNLLVTI
jgi:pantoate--beta-alanine ligase